MAHDGMDDIKGLIEKQGKAFEEFKAANELRLAEVIKKGSADPLLEEKLTKMSKAIDDAADAKAALEKRFDKEQKEREELELRLTRARSGGADNLAEETKAYNLVLSASAGEKGAAAELIDEEGYRHLKSGFNRFMRKGMNFASAPEQKALLVASDPQGGIFVPVDFAGRIVQRVFETSPIRQLANIVKTSTEEQSGIEDLNEVGVGYADEPEPPVETSTPDVGRWRMAVHELRAEPRISQKLLEDAGFDVENWLMKKVSDRFSRFQNKEFVIGANRIRGFMTYPATPDSGSGVPWGQIGTTATGQAGGFKTTNSADCLFDLIGLLKPAYLPNATFITRRAVITKIRQLKDGQGRYLWEPALTKGRPETILGYPITFAEDMAGLSDGSLSLVFGDFREAYQILDRLGMSVIRDNLTQKPWVKFYTRMRVGAGVLNFEALKYLKFAVN